MIYPCINSRKATHCDTCFPAICPPASLCTLHLILFVPVLMKNFFFFPCKIELRASAIGRFLFRFLWCREQPSFLTPDTAVLSRGSRHPSKTFSSLLSSLGYFNPSKTLDAARSVVFCFCFFVCFLVSCCFFSDGLQTFAMVTCQKERGRAT